MDEIGEYARHGDSVELAHAMRMLFWGSLIVSLDFTLDTASFRLDILPDIVGWLIVGTTLSTLRRLAYSHGLTLGLIPAAVVCGVIAWFFGFTPPSATPPVIGVIVQTLALVQALGAISLCGLMALVCAAGHLPELEGRWILLKRIGEFVGLPFILLGLGLSLIGIGAGWRSMHYQVGSGAMIAPLILLVLGVIAVIITLLVYSLVTIHRTRVAALEGRLP